MMCIWNLNLSGLPVVLVEEQSGTIISRDWEGKGHVVWKEYKRYQEELVLAFCGAVAELLVKTVFDVL